MRAMLRWTALAALLTLAGCNDGGALEPVGGVVDPLLVGRWVLALMSVDGTADFDPATIGWEFRVELLDTGAFNYEEVWLGATDSGGGTWGTTGNRLMMRAGAYDWSGTYSVTATQFVIADVANYDGEGHTGRLTFNRL